MTTISSSHLATLLFANIWCEMLVHTVHTSIHVIFQSALPQTYPVAIGEKLNWQVKDPSESRTNNPVCRGLWSRGVYQEMTTPLDCILSDKAALSSDVIALTHREWP